MFMITVKTMLTMMHDMSGKLIFIPPRVIDELCAARTTAKDYAEAYTGAVTAQAERYKIKPAALKRYIAAKEADKLDDLDAEMNDLEKLIG